jgi:GT2 family glycosyltransferase
MSRPFVSVLIDTYNHERFVEEAVQSVLAQDFPASEREILVVDDGSTDQTPEILRKYEPQIRILRKQNGGQASAFNLGIPECKGEIVAFLDADDWWAPGKLTATANAFAANPEVGLVGHGIVEVFTDGAEIRQVLRDGPRFRVNSTQGAHLFRLRKAFFGTSRMAFRAPILRRIGVVPDALWVQADEYLFTLGAVFADALVLADALTYYRIHGANGFLVSQGNVAGMRRKYQVLNALAAELQRKMAECDVPTEVRGVITESVQNEADLIRLDVDGGLPWETFSAERTGYRINHPEVSAARRFLKTISLLPAFVLPPRSFYSIRRSLAGNPVYRKFREKWPHSPALAHVDRQASGKS